jgi:hypothetical protein
MATVVASTASRDLVRDNITAAAMASAANNPDLVVA